MRAAPVPQILRPDFTITQSTPAHTQREGGEGRGGEGRGGEGRGGGRGEGRGRRGEGDYR